MSKQSKSKGSDKILKIPCTFEDYKLKKTTNEMIISFAIIEENVNLAKSLLNSVQEPYVLLLYKQADKDDLDGMASIGIDGMGNIGIEEL